MTTAAEGRQRFRPTLKATAIALPAFLILIALGVWQVQRLTWKTAIIATREARLTAPPLTDAAALTAADLDALVYRRVRLAGHFLAGHDVYLARSRGGKVGFQAITPLVAADGTTVLVDRGWVPPAARKGTVAAPPAGETVVEGVVRLASRKGWFTPDNDVARNYWFWLDPPAMAAAAGVTAPPLVIQVTVAPATGPPPWPANPRVDIPNNHLGYALTWFGLAIALAVIFVLSQRKPAR